MGTRGGRGYAVSSSEFLRADGGRVEKSQGTDPAQLLERCRVAAADLGVPFDAVILVRLVLESLTRAQEPWAGSDQISAVTLCEGLLRCDATAECSADQLRRVGIDSSEVVGRIVDWLVRDRIIRPRADDSEGDYRGLFDLRANRRDRTDDAHRDGPGR